MRRELYENQPIRTAWDEDNKEWYFAIFDVIAVLAESSNPQTCWRVIKKRLKNEGNETVTNCHGLKMKAAMEKRMTDISNTEQLWRIIQSIQSKKAELSGGLDNIYNHISDDFKEIGMAENYDRNRNNSRQHRSRSYRKIAPCR